MSAHQLFHRAYELVTVHILWMWLLALVFIVAAGWLITGYCQPEFPGDSGSAGDSRKNLAGRFGLADGAAAIVLFAFVAAYAAVILHKEDFAYYDDDLMTEFSVRGINFSPPVWPAQGRFYPLADQEFNVVQFFTRSPAGYHALVVAELLILLALLFLFLKALPARYRVVVIIMAMAAPSFLIPFSGFVYPERNVLFWLVVMLLCLQGYAETRSRYYFIGCLVATHGALYYKETVVLFVVAYAVTRLFLELYFARSGGARRCWQEFASKQALPLAMLGVSAIYVLFFAMAMLPHRNLSYINAIRSPLNDVVFAYIQTDWLPLLLLVVLLIRMLQFLFSRSALDVLWDSLAVGALAYYFAVLALRINSGYYMAPVDLIALLYLAKLAAVWLSKPSKIRVAAVAIMGVLVLMHDLAYSTFRVAERKGIIATKSKFAEFLENYAAMAKRERVALFFPYADNYHLMGLASYLRYKGFPLEGQPQGGDKSLPLVLITSPGKFENHRCVDYRNYVCIHADTSGPDALIVIMPDDNVSMSDVRSASGGAKSVFHAQGCAACTKLNSWCRSLHAISAEYSAKELPEHWLQLDVYHRRQ